LDFAELVLKRLGETWIRTDDYIDWANELLEGGCDAPSIWELAACCWDADPDPVQVERLFQSCIGELGLELPSDWYGALRAYSAGICEKMIRGKISPWDCACEMLTIADDHYEPYIHWIWIDLVDNLSPQRRIQFNGVLDLEDVDGCIRKVAQQFIILCSLSLPEKFPWVWRCEVCGAVSEVNTFTEIKTCTCVECGGVSTMKNMRFFEHRDALINMISQQP